MEVVVWATKPGAPYHFEPWENAGAPECHNFIDGPICAGKERLGHPTQKPEWLFKALLERHAHDFSHVLDPFAGVGTTLAVCQRLGICATGVEINADYVTQARLRLAGIAKEMEK
jgi:DNA modification methylase